MTTIRVLYLQEASGDRAGADTKEDGMTERERAAAVARLRTALESLGPPAEAEDKAYHEEMWRAVMEEAPDWATRSAPDGMRYGYMAGYLAGVIAFIDQGLA